MLNAVLRAVFVAGFSACVLLVPIDAFAQCDNSVEMKGYSLCLPRRWRVFKDGDSDRISSCNNALGKCTGDGGGFPLMGILFLTLSPAGKLAVQDDKTPGKSHTARNIDDIVSSAPTNITRSSVFGIELQGDPSSKKKCKVA